MLTIQKESTFLSQVGTNALDHTRQTPIKLAFVYTDWYDQQHILYQEKVRTYYFKKPLDVEFNPEVPEINFDYLAVLVIAYLLRIQ